MESEGNLKQKIISWFIHFITKSNIIRIQGTVDVFIAIGGSFEGAIIALLIFIYLNGSVAKFSKKSILV